MSEYRLKTPKQAEAVTKGYKKIEDTVVGAYKKIEGTVVGGYKKIEDAVVGSYKGIEEKFVDAFLVKDGGEASSSAPQEGAGPGE